MTIFNLLGEVEIMVTAGMKTTANSGDSIMEPLLTVEQLAVMVKRSHWTLRRDIKAGRISCVRMGRALRIEASEVRRIMNEGLASSASPK
jgi:excisionase family DNA binding protein